MMRGIAAKGPNGRKKPREHLENRHFSMGIRGAFEARRLLASPQSQSRQKMSDDVTIQIYEPKSQIHGRFFQHPTRQIKEKPQEKVYRCPESNLHSRPGCTEGISVEPGKIKRTHSADHAQPGKKRRHSENIANPVHRWALVSRRHRPLACSHWKRFCLVDGQKFHAGP